MAQTVLEVNNLEASVPFEDRPQRCFGPVSFSVSQGECLGIIGERESGKSTLLLAALGLFERVMHLRIASMQAVRTTLCRILPPTVVPSAEKWVGSVIGSSTFHGESLLGEYKDHSQRDIAFLPENKSSNEEAQLFRRDEDLGETLRKTLSETSLRLIEVLGLDHLVTKAKEQTIQSLLLKPSEVRLIRIFEALTDKPSLLVIDEPTDSLGTTDQANLIDALKVAREETGLAMIVATQDAGFLTELADRIAVLYTGRIVEMGEKSDVLYQPTHPYASGLMACNPTIMMIQMRRGIRKRLRGVPGTLPNPWDLPPGCAFHPRCSEMVEECRVSTPEIDEKTVGHWIACHQR
ncbi:MAG: ABC transporter ATP-binding protein [Candidatus Thorarchaeota archaeon]|nr:MAG: ABC transporter ATP-binding protein [Candidatus Thorarchaeota archaeon]